MSSSPVTEPSLPLLIGVAAIFLFLSLAVWSAAIGRWARTGAMLPWTPRRPVPWGGVHLAMIVLVYFGLGNIVPWLFVALFGSSDKQGMLGVPEREAAETPLLILLKHSPALGTLVLCLVVAVIAAPVVEEFVFRLVLQGWLEARESRLRGSLPPRCWFPAGICSLLLAAVPFAALHYRSPVTDAGPTWIALAMTGKAVADLLTLGFGWWLLRADAGATAEDFGLSRAKFFADLRLGFLAFLACAFLVYGLKFALSHVCPENVADPLAVFVFALFLGALYWRTHRIVPSIALHMSLNFTSLMVAWFGAAGR
jgi:membrane protease YdiL (CAAX protease family)